MEKFIIILIIIATVCCTSQNQTGKESTINTLPETQESLTDNQVILNDSLINHIYNSVQNIDTNYFFNHDILEEYLVLYQGTGKYFFENTIYPKYISEYIADRGLFDKMFPFSAYDSVIIFNSDVHEKSLYPHAIDFDHYKKHNEIRWADKFKYKRVKRLKKKETDHFLRIINQPRNFGFAECGTTFPEQIIMFYSADSICASVVFGCDFGQILSYPFNYRNKFGSIDHQPLKNEIKRLITTTGNRVGDSLPTHGL